MKRQWYTLWYAYVDRQSQGQANWFVCPLYSGFWISDQFVHRKMCCLNVMLHIQTLTLSIYKRFLLPKKSALQLKGVANNQNPAVYQTASNAAFTSILFTEPSTLFVKFIESPMKLFSFDDLIMQWGCPWCQYNNAMGLSAESALYILADCQCLHVIGYSLILHMSV